MSLIVAKWMGNCPMKITETTIFTNIPCTHCQTVTFRGNTCIIVHSTLGKIESTGRLYDNVISDTW